METLKTVGIEFARSRCYSRAATVNAIFFNRADVIPGFFFSIKEELFIRPRYLAAASE